ncbi:MAG: hypothetical protein IJT95_00205 [Abditibacteriota bacterium]|nr:hypothetical protein [Abditibacteriota bacterium]
MKVYCVIDSGEQARVLQAEGWYTPAYLPCMLKDMGVTAETVSPEGLDRVLPEDVVFAPKGTALPDCRSITYPACAPRERGIKARFDLDGVTVFLSVPLEGEPVKKTERSLTFGFDLPGQVWFSEDGFPREPQNFFVKRVPDSTPLADEDKATEPYNTAIENLIIGTLLDWGIPVIATLPPIDGSLPDFGFMVSGDDDACSRDINLEAGQVMHGLGIKYHINAMPAGPDRFCISKEDYDALKAMGTETALHLDLTAKPEELASETVRQEALFEKVFGEHPVTNCNHCLVQPGEVQERLAALAGTGIIADNSKMGEIDRTDINAFDLTGFGFGTIHPRTTAAKTGEAIECAEVPMTYYEPRIGSKYGEDTGKLARYLQLAEKYMAVCQFFIHPHYLCSNNEHSAWSTRALRYALEYFKSKKVWMTSTNELAVWWKGRRASRAYMENGILKTEARAPIAVLLPKGTVAPAGSVRETAGGVKYIIAE